MSGIGKRLSHLIEGENITPYKLWQKSGVSQATLSRILNKDQEPNESNLKALADYFGVNENWLLTGEESYSDRPTGFYYPDVRASAGLDTAFENEELVRIPVSIPNFGNDIDFINVYGDSMYPKYCSGEIIGIKEVEPQYLNFGYAYVVILKDGQVFLKYINKGKDEEHWELSSENPKYDPREFHLSLIKKIFIIKGVITKTTM